MLHALAAALLALTAQQPSSPPTEPYTLGPDSQVQAGVPKGRVEGPFLFRSQVFAGTIRHYWIYVPAQYVAGTPAAVMVFQDGHKYVDVNAEYRVPMVFDNLIHAKEMPVTIGIFVNPGHFGETYPENQWRGNNRSVEYDTPSDRYARFVIDELLPGSRQEVRAHDRPRPARHRRRQLRRHLRVHGRLGAAGCLSQGAQPHRQLHQHPRRPRLPGRHPQERPQAAARVPAGRQQRPGQPARQLAAGQPGDGRGAEVQGLRLQVRVRRRRAHAQPRRRDPARLAALAVAEGAVDGAGAAVHARRGFAGPARRAAWRGDEAHVDQHDLPGDDAGLLGLRAEAVRPGEAGGGDGVPGRRRATPARTATGACRSSSTT